MSSARAVRGTRPAPPVATASDAPAVVPLTRDRWAWAGLVVLVLVLVRAWGVPFGEPVADDFDHLHHVLFSRDHSWWGGGGSTSFWRPLAYQAYYGAFTGVILSHPGWVTVLHTVLAAITVLAVYDTLRRRVAARVAPMAAAFPGLLESSRALLAVPVQRLDQYGQGCVVFSPLPVVSLYSLNFCEDLLGVPGAWVFRNSDFECSGISFHITHHPGSFQAQIPNRGGDKATLRKEETWERQVT